MKLLSFIGWLCLLWPLVIIAALATDMLPWSWIWGLLIALGLPLMILISLLILAIYIIKSTPPEEWNR